VSDEMNIKKKCGNKNVKSFLIHDGCGKSATRKNNNNSISICNAEWEKE
jgi:hypothetical protein